MLRGDRPRLVESGPSGTPPGVEARGLRAKRGAPVRASRHPVRLPDSQFGAPSGQAEGGKAPPCRAETRCRKIGLPGRKAAAPRTGVLRCTKQGPRRDRSAMARLDFFLRQILLALARIA